MSSPFIGEIRLFAGNFAPNGWAFCQGQLLAISENSALFSLIGTTYGGDGTTTFGLPDLRGRVPVHFGQGPGLSNYALGSTGGAENVSLNSTQIPSHSHTLAATTDIANQGSPAANNLAQSNSVDLYIEDVPNTALSSASITPFTGGSQSHNNMQPTLAIYYIISLFGVYPSRS